MSKWDKVFIGLFCVSAVMNLTLGVIGIFTGKPDWDVDILFALVALLFISVINLESKERRRRQATYG